ncbi:helix-turn-helix domain-containing protein [Agrobacterium rosae]|uniref:Helix-turn-helix domain-containing protein n=1 Tax=Agrobacterium rosae TaxID=1972867 RepID=A0AAW9FRR5_9HYPH|nr:helix-turn-helix domain-containing protein [Agrobacterium rosae]MDX8305861.1 helix-turn-helix domain-containing protein [Agrobacterium rosae]
MFEKTKAAALAAPDAGACALFAELAADISLLHGDDLESKRSQIWKEWAGGRLTDEQASHLVELLTTRSGAAQRVPHQTALPGFQSSRKPAAIAPVRRESWRKGREAGFWRPLEIDATKGIDEAKDIMTAARRFDEAQRREKGGRIGPLGPIGLEVLQLFVNMAKAYRGRLFPPLTWIMEKLKRSKCAVVEALARLRDHGFLDWRRRYEPTGTDGPGPQVKQVSNAYRLIPETARRLLSFFAKSPPSPVPADVEQQRQERQTEVDSFETFERESVQRSERSSNLYSYLGEKADGLSNRLLFRPLAGQADGRRR